MPEYLAPKVYVEEVDTGAKPIEGVSTSTCGMLGVTERGPANVAILVTSYGEYRRWFGDTLNPGSYGEHRYLPYAVQGFFANGGKRVYVTRVVASDGGNLASAQLFTQADTSLGATLLARSPGGAASALFVASAIGGGIAANDWVRIGTGSDAEYRQASAVPAVSLTGLVAAAPLQRAHAAGTSVEHYAALPAAAGLPYTLLADAPAGATSLTLAGATVLVGDRLLQVMQGSGPALRAELVFVRGVVDLGGNWRAELDTPLAMDHAHGATVQLLAALAAPAAGDVTTLAHAAVPGDGVLSVAANGVFAGGDWLRVVDGTRGEFRRIGEVHALGFDVPVGQALAAGTALQPLTRVDDGAITVKQLAAPAGTTTVAAAAGALSLGVDDRQGLVEGQLLRIGAETDPDVEYVLIRDLPDRASGPDAGRILLDRPLARAHGGTSAASRKIVAVQALTEQNGAATLLLDAGSGATTAFVSAPLLAAAPTAADLVRVVMPGGAASYLRIADDDMRAVQELMLTIPLLAPHAAPQPVIERTPLLAVVALDSGVWGNRLRIAAARETTPLVRTRIRADATGIQDPTHIRLDSASGIEPGTVLSLVDADGQPIDAPFKVVAIDRGNGFLLTLAAALPASAGLASALISLEFTVSAFLLRQPDPAQPARDVQVYDVETYRHLSLDVRHSRYVQHVVGTTFTFGADLDDGGQALRLADRRSEGLSAYVRVRDLAQDLAEPARTNALHGIRIGPEFLLDLVNGRQQPGRLALTGGDDHIGAITDADYIGIDDPEPARRTGLQTLRGVDQISLVAAPGRVGSALQGELIAHCELLRYRYAVLDGPPPPDDTLADVTAQRQQFDTRYAALYHPWLLIPDPYPLSSGTVPDLPVPPSGHVLGVIARTDIDRGVHKAPANEVVRGIVGLQRSLNSEQQDILNPAPLNINVIRDFRPNSRGIRIYGARNITSDPDWRYLNVRRTMIFIEASIDLGLQWVVFEPNAEPLWARVRRSITNFLTLVWRNGALEGTKPEEAFFVKCDRTTMTQTDIDLGRLICLVGVAPVKPAEYVIVRIGLWTAQADT